MTDWTGALFSKFLVFPLLEINHGQCFSLHRRTLLLASLAAAALPSFPADAAVRRELRYATLGLDTSDPHRHTGSIAVQQCYAEPLTSIADDGQVKPFLAEK